MTSKVLHFLLFLFSNFSPLWYIFPVFSQHQTLLLRSSPLTLQPALGASISYVIFSLDAKCLPYQSHFRIYSFPLAKDYSISHCSTPTFTSSHPIVVMVNSISHTPSPSPANSITTLIHLREGSFLLGWCDWEVRPEKEKKIGCFISINS